MAARQLRRWDNKRLQKPARSNPGNRATAGTDHHLPGGVSATVPIAVWRDAAGRTLPEGSAPIAPRKPVGFIPAAFDRTTRLAAVVSAWTVFQHFYPYFDVVEVDWTGELERALRTAATDPDPAAFHKTLRRLVAALDDGHGAVRYDDGPVGILPLAWQEVEGRLAITGTGPEAAGLKAGDLVTHIGGVPTPEAIQEAAALSSGSPQWVRWRAAQELLSGPAGKAVEIRTVSPAGEARAAQLLYAPRPYGQQVREGRPGKIVEIKPGVV